MNPSDYWREVLMHCRTLYGFGALKRMGFPDFDLFEITLVDMKNPDLWVDSIQLDVPWDPYTTPEQLASDVAHLAEVTEHYLRWYVKE